MAQTHRENEKKFLLYEQGKDFSTPQIAELFKSVEELKRKVVQDGQLIYQGYLPKKEGEKLADDIGVRLDFPMDIARLRDVEGVFYVTYKSKGNTQRDELEEEIKENVFSRYWSKTKGKRLEKFRIEKKVGNQIIDIDYYPHLDLLIAEVEVKNAQDLGKIMPLGKDVSKVKKYKNSQIAKMNL